MSANSKIEWTHHTFNPWWGCAKVSPACDNCYAERDAGRFAPNNVYWGVDAERREFGDKHWNEPIRWNRRAAEQGIRERVFCASMADVFDKNAPAGARQRLLSLIADTPNLDWLLLTKRIGNAERMLQEACMHDGRLMDASDRYRPLQNLWLGISVVNQDEADRDIPKLLAVPAAIRFLSMEPLLGPVNLRGHLLKCCNNPKQGCGGSFMQPDDPPECCGEMDHGIDWVIVGGESGPRARPMHPDWVRSLRDQCAEAGVPFLFKQWGEYIGGEIAPNPDDLNDACAWRLDQRGHRWHDPMEGSKPREEWSSIKYINVGKKAAGRLLDGVQHDGYPEAEP